MSNYVYLGNSKEYMVNPTTKITYNDHMMIIDFNIGSFRQSSYLFSKEELVSREELQAVYSLELPQEIKHKIIKHIEIENLRHNIIMLTVDLDIDIAFAYVEQENREVGPSYIYEINSDNEELDI